MTETEPVDGLTVYPSPESMRPTLIGRRWSVVGGHPLVTQVAADVLARGGNAVDAGVAAGLASNVVQPDMCNLGGIASVIVRRAGDPTPYSVAGVGNWGAAADRAGILDRYGGDLPPGVSSIVPGALSAWVTTLERFGTWSFADVAAGAIELAVDGFALDQRTAQSLAITGLDFAQWESSRAVYWPRGRAPVVGEQLVQPALGRLIARLAAAEQGPSRSDRLAAVHDAFYRSDVARTIVDFVATMGGCLSADDLARFRAEVAPAPSVEHAGWRVHVTPTWSQGLVVAQALALLEPFDLRAMGHNSADYLHHVVEALKLAFDDREQHYAEPAFLAQPVEELLSADHIDRLRSRLGDRARPRPSAPGAPDRPVRSTTAVTVVDADGNAFAAAISDTLDGGPIIPELGILCSHRGVQSRLTAGHPNALAPGKRPVVTPSALIALRDSGSAERSDVWAMACPGADVIVQAMLQVALNRTQFGLTPQQAVEAPRVSAYSFPAGFHPHAEQDRLVRVESRIPAAVRADLSARGHRVEPWPPYEFDAGSVQMSLALRGPGSATGADSGPVLSAGADPRRSAYAWVR